MSSAGATGPSRFHRRSRWSILLGLAVSLAPRSFAAELEDRRSKVQEKLESERGVLAALNEQRVGILEALEVAEKRQIESEAKVKATANELTGLELKLAAQVQRERDAEAAVNRALDDLGPRLRWLYRFSRPRQLDWILSSTDMACLFRRSRALESLVHHDLSLFAQASQAMASLRSARAELQRLGNTVSLQLSLLQTEKGSAARQKDELAELLEVIRADAKHHVRLRIELEREEQKLTRMIERLARTPADSAFLRLKGTLPMPAQGVIEVSFGQVINPKFNTVVQQKGLDIRAGAQSPVRAVARGKVVYAAWMRGYGNLLIVDHGDGFHTLMAHMSEFVRQPGDPVEPGDVIGLVGESGSLKGPYLYFELRQNGEAINPAPWFSGSARALRLR